MRKMRPRKLAHVAQGATFWTSKVIPADWLQSRSRPQPPCPQESTHPDGESLSHPARSSQSDHMSYSHSIPEEVSRQDRCAERRDWLLWTVSWPGGGHSALAG